MPGRCLGGPNRLLGRRLGQRRTHLLRPQLSRPPSSHPGQLGGNRMRDARQLERSPLRDTGLDSLRPGRESVCARSRLIPSRSQGRQSTAIGGALPGDRPLLTLSQPRKRGTSRHLQRAPSRRRGNQTRPPGPNGTRRSRKRRRPSRSRNRRRCQGRGPRRSGKKWSRGPKQRGLPELPETAI